MIKFADDGYHSQIKNLWKNTFEDKDELIDFYFSNRHRNENMLIFLKGEVVAAMLTMLPLEIKSGEKTFAGRYIYAVATDKKYRGQGISTMLLNHAHNWMKRNHEQVSVLVPASKSLFDFYEKRGFKTVFKIDFLEISSDEISKNIKDLKCTSCNLEKFIRIRNAAFGNSSLFAKWGEQALEYIMKFSNFSAEGLCCFHNNFGEGYAVYERAENTIVIKEIALINLQLQEALSALHCKLRAKLYKIRLPEKIGGARAVTKNFGMIHWLTDEPNLIGEPPYLALALD